jgi:hypothetical protein
MLSSKASRPIDATVSADATVSQMKVDSMAVVFCKVGLTENTVHEVNQTGSYEISRIARAYAAKNSTFVSDHVYGK